MKERFISAFSVFKKSLPALFLVLFIAASGTAYYFYQRIPKEPSAQTEVKALVAQVGQLIVLPQGEDPTVATVVDPEKLKDQPFFANAKKGNKVLIYTNEKKAILYDPESNKIVEVAPVNIGNPSPVPTSTVINKK